MSEACLGCTCRSAVSAFPVGAACPGELLFATRIQHTATALRTAAARPGVEMTVLRPGLLRMRTTDVTGFVELVRGQLSSVEAEEVRCLHVGSGRAADTIALARDDSMLAMAMLAPTLAEAAAQAGHVGLLPLFEDEINSFHAVYQPIVDLRSRQRVGFEALLRATGSDGRGILPDVLFGAAEAADWTNLLDRVGRTTALRHAAGWLGGEQLFINFVPTSIYRPEVCLRTTEVAAREAGVRLDQIVFEVTEGHRVRDIDHLERIFAYYRGRNCRVAMDDVGAGYSSLNLLVRLRPDVVKLDKDLVQSLPDPVSYTVVSAIVDIAHSYGGLVLAECVETAQQAQMAQDLGCDLAQGWFFGRPERPGVPQPRRGEARRAVTGRHAIVTPAPTVGLERPGGQVAR